MKSKKDEAGGRDAAGHSAHGADYKLVEDTLGETMLVLVVAKGYVSRLMRNENISTYLGRHHADLARELATVMEAVASEARAPGRE